ncbi:uncharacterized protein AB9W97_012498 isoform 1-T1 [Spinachia spinachia]
MSTCQGSWIRLNLPCPSADPESTISLVASANLFNEYSEGRLSHTSVPGSYSSEYSEGAVDRSMASIIRACTPTRSRCSLPLAISSHRRVSLGTVCNLEGHHRSGSAICWMNEPWGQCKTQRNSALPSLLDSRFVWSCWTERSVWDTAGQGDEGRPEAKKRKA